MLSDEPVRGTRDRWLNGRAAMTMFALAIGLTGCPRDWGVLPDAGSDDHDAGQSGTACGSRGLAQCADDEYCDFPASAQCGAADAPGVCKDRPEICRDIYAPVCGCDGKTYPNDCTAAASGVSVASTGECKQPTPPDGGTGGESCGGLEGKGCSDGEYCKFDPKAQCGAADQTGVCTKRPEVCTRIYSPVCGCDDKTYGNECEAAAAGVSIISRGECKKPEEDGGMSGQACGGLRGLQCAKDQFCNFPPDAFCGAADATGICEPIPQACTADYRPVCGCDGKTYGNACTAHSAGVSVAAEGECEPSGGQSCGGLRGQACPDGEFCDFPPDAICGAADATGTCVPKPDACTKQYKPVCGCDGKTYGNACEAHAAGVSVQAEGECEPSGGQSCGGLRGKPCPDGEYCNFPPDAICGFADATGICAPKPGACTKEYKPVCGCDGKTYGNACTAAAAGVSVKEQGECNGGNQSCGGLLGTSCPDGQYCNFPKDALCGAADQTGICTDIPDVCTLELNPVCGCDDKTYDNACLAAAAGVSVSKQGACDSQPSGEFCGGFAGKQCENKGEYCNFPESTNCGSGDQGGTCAKIPDVCTLEFAPVCGCDGMTYPNRCAAAAAAISVQASGECP